AAAVIRVERAQQKVKERCDKQASIIEELKKGELVLVFKASQENSKSHKLSPKWKEPFVIHKIQTKGVFKLRTLDENIIKTPINRKLLKRYYVRKN
ncbi:22357_t:CDS:1, partial [Cetraspora pellucida]